MRVEFVEPDYGFAAILADPAFGDLIELVMRDETILGLVAQVIKSYQTRPSLDGAGGQPAIEAFVATFASRPRSKSSAGKTSAAFRALYANHDPRHVRGAILEGMVEQRLKVRYSGQDHDLVNNHKIRCSDDDHAPYVSSTTVDVIGWDRTVGECHDCKVAARGFDSAFIGEMETNLVPRRFKIGMVTADTQAQTSVELQRKNFRPRSAQVIPFERLWQMAPLQA